MQIFSINHANQFVDAVVVMGTCGPEIKVSYIMAEASWNRRYDIHTYKWYTKVTLLTDKGTIGKTFLIILCIGFFLFFLSDDTESLETWPRHWMLYLSNEHKMMP
jgi:hypothetical protein